jgi:hypothetical protein
MPSFTGQVSATLQSMLLFLIVSSPFTYRCTNSLLSGVMGRLADSSGCPTTLGLAVHTVVFGLCVYGLMQL